MKVGIISDTHGVFSKEFKEFLEPVDVLWHAGDFGGSREFVKEIAAFKPLIGVYGNCDGQDIRQECPLVQLFNCEGKKILMTHIGGYPGKYDLKALALIESHRPDVFVCGHSHILKVVMDKQYDMLVINPGACGLQGWQIYRTAIRMDIHDGKIDNFELFKLER